MAPVSVTPGHFISLSDFAHSNNLHINLVQISTFFKNVISSSDTELNNVEIIVVRKFRFFHTNLWIQELSVSFQGKCRLQQLVTEPII